MMLTVGMSTHTQEVGLRQVEFLRFSAFCGNPLQNVLKLPPGRAPRSRHVRIRRRFRSFMNNAGQDVYR